MEILERFQSKTLRMIVDAPWYVPNTGYPKRSPNTNSERINPPLQLSIQRSPQRTPNGLVEQPDNNSVNGKTPAK
jgi:hypothetical protein